MKWRIGAIALGLSALPVVLLLPEIVGSTPEVPLFPGPGPQVRSRGRTALDIVRWNETCETCHVSEARAWKASRHHQSFDNGAFTAALDRELPSGRAFCRACHAPEAIESGAADEASSMGVACVTCHAPLGPILATGDGSTEAPHGLFRTRAFAGADACKRCHEFEFPNSTDGALMQRTVSEQAETEMEAPCVSCHMRRPDRPSHAFAGGYDEALVRSSLAVRASETGCHVRVEIASTLATHAVPTGDLFRRLVVEVVPRAQDGSSLAAIRRYLSRHFDRSTGRQREIGDDRPRRAPRTIDVEVEPGACGRGGTVRVAYERVAFNPDDDESRAIVESAFDVTNTELTVEAEARR